MKIASNFPPLIKVSVIQNVAEFELKYLKILSEALQFKYETINPPDSEWGRKLSDGNWTGLIGQVARGETDMAMAFLFSTEERKTVVDISEPYFYDETVFVTNLPKTFPGSFDYTKPFTKEMWFFVLFIFMLSPFIFRWVCLDRH